MRASGILLHISSLPSPHGIGTLGQAAYRFVDFLVRAGQTYWQILPIGPTGVGDSPYQSCSAFAGNPYLIDLDDLISRGLLTEDEVCGVFWGENAEKVDFGALYAGRFAVLEKAYRRGLEQERAAFATFRTAQPWVEDYGLYMALKRKFGLLPWYQWPKAAARRQADALDRYREELADDISFYAFVQYLFYDQWARLHAYAKERGVKIIGDIPIYVPIDSADVWLSPELFQLDRNLTPKAVAGVPPDAFTEDGQLWGNPLYDWAKMKKDGFAWWKRRVKGAAAFFDMIRIDHFRGLESYWAVPYGDENARGGKWMPGPGMALIRAIKDARPDTAFIAEDLGVITPPVRKLQERSGFPGMKVMEFAFDGGTDNAYLPHNVIPGCVYYTGTHDNETLAQWYAGMAPGAREFLTAYLGLNEREGVLRGILRGGMTSTADLFIAQLQDWLGLGAEARMNTPGLLSDKNWSWRLDKLPEDALADEIRAMTQLSGRLTR